QESLFDDPSRTAAAIHAQLLSYEHQARWLIPPPFDQGGAPGDDRVCTARLPGAQVIDRHAIRTKRNTLNHSLLVRASHGKMRWYRIEDAHSYATRNHRTSH